MNTKDWRVVNDTFERLPRNQPLTIRKWKCYGCQTQWEEIFDRYVAVCPKERLFLCDDCKKEGKNILPE